MYGFDPMYFVFMVPGIIISMWASAKVKSTFAKYQNVPIQNQLTGAQAARKILDANGLQHVAVQRVNGNLSDHYDPRTEVVSLSDSTYASASVGAVGVAAHECGHAVQHSKNYLPAQIRSAIVPVCNWGSKLSVPIIFVGFLISILQLVYLGVALFSLAVLFQLVTLPVEFDASHRALVTLNEQGMVTQEESAGVRKVLTAAGLTYVAALLTSLLQLLYYLSMANRRRR